MASRPSQFRSGDTYEWQESFSGYDASLYTAKGIIVGEGGVQALTASGSGTIYTFTPTITIQAAGQYRIQLWVELTSDSTKRFTQIDQPVTLLAKYSSTSTPTDTRTTARKALDAIEAAIQVAVAIPHNQLGAHMRTVGYRDLKEMFDTRDRIKAEVASEENTQGENVPGIAYGRFVIT